MAATAVAGQLGTVQLVDAMLYVAHTGCPSTHENRAIALMLDHLTQHGVTGRLDLVLVGPWGHRSR